MTDRHDLRREGQAQQDKADAQRDAGKKEAEAEVPGALQGPTRSARLPNNNSARKGPAPTMSRALPAFGTTSTTATAVWSRSHVDGANAGR